MQKLQADALAPKPAPAVARLCYVRRFMGPLLQVNGHGTLTSRRLRALRAASLSWLLTGAWADDQGVAIDATNFPDANFRSYVLDNCDTDNNGYLSDTEIANVTTISCSNKGISDLKG